MPAMLEEEPLMPTTRSMTRGWVPAAMRWLLALCCTMLAAAAPAQQPPAPAGGARPEATVSLYNRPIAVFRAPFLGLSPSERAERTQRAIADLLDRGGPGQVSVQKEPQGSVLLVDGGLALILTPQDVDALRGETLDSATRTAAAALSRVIDDKKEERDRRRVLTAIGVSLLATVVYALAMHLLGKLRAALWRRASALMDRAHLSETALGQATRFRIAAQWMMRGVGWLLAIVLTYQWAVFVLLQFPRTRAAGEQLGGFVLQILARLGAGALDALPDLAVAIVIFVLARAVVAVLGSLFEHVEQSGDSAGWMPADLARPTRRLVNVFVWIFAVVMAYPYLPGAHSEAFKGMSVFVGLMITLGGSSLVGQGASGLILMYSRTLRIGDYVRISGEEGTVVDLGMFTTRIHTGMGHEVTLPNAVVMSSVTRNFSRASVAQNTLIDTAVTIGYDVPWREVHAILLEAARRTPGVVAQPRPWVAQTALSDFYIEYQLIAQMDATRPEKRLEVLTTLNANVVDVFNEHGVQIMSPHYMGDPAQAKVVDAGHTYAAPRKG
jgi:small-conductance mechanosensitive channel